MIGWKQAYTIDRGSLVLVKLYIPSTAKVRLVSKQQGNQYVCDKAKVLAITSLGGKFRVTCAASMKDGNFKYRVGEEVSFYTDPGLGDKPGIYFFKTKQEAIAYEY